jgi:hypothetical protein
MNDYFSSRRQAMFLSNKKLAAFLLTCFMLTGCGKDPEKPAAVADTTSNPPAKTPENSAAKQDGPLDLFANATPATALNHVEIKEGKILKAWTSTAHNAVPTVDGKMVFIGDNDKVDEGKAPHLLGIEVATKNKKYDWEVKGPELDTLALSADGSVIALYRDSKKAPGLIEIWETATGKKRTKFQHPLDKESSFSNEIEALALSPDGKIAVSATGFQDNNFKRNYHAWSTENGKQLWKLTTSYICQPSFTSDGKQVLCWYQKGPALVDAKTGKITQQFPANNDGAHCELTLTKDDKAILVHASEDQPDPPGRQTYLIKIDRTTGKREYCVNTGEGKSSDRMMLLGDGLHVGLLQNYGNQSDVQIRQISDGSLKASLRVNELAVGEDGNFMPDGKTFLLQDKLWELPNWQ